jgi:hypothetical protein
MSITMPSPVWCDDSFELCSGELSNGAATNLLDHGGDYNQKPKVRKMTSEAKNASIF